MGAERANQELKAHSRLKPGTFRRKPELREPVESVFEQMRYLPITIFGVVMERPEHPLPRSDSKLMRFCRITRRLG